MGREIRKVIHNWEHPKREKYNPFKRIMEESFQPMHDCPADQAWKEWLADFQKWKDGGRKEEVEKYELEYEGMGDYESFCAWAGRPPNPVYYRPAWNEEDMTWFQLYETVSEGTPVTPAFETQDELIDYLVEHGDYWDQKRRKAGDSIMNCDPWPRDQAEKFVKGAGWAPSMVSDGTKMMSGVEFVTRAKQQTSYDNAR
jgi:hypothetical protein